MEELSNAQEQERIQYIVVKFGDEQYGIDIKYIDNIVRMQRITRVPKVQSYIKGVINLRGEVIPVVSIRLKMGLFEDEITKKTRIIIIRLDNGEIIGMLVDEVKEVVHLNPQTIETPSFKLDEKNAAYLAGIGKKGDTLISLLNIENVVGDTKTA